MGLKVRVNVAAFNRFKEILDKAPNGSLKFRAMIIDKMKELQAMHPKELGNEEIPKE